MNLLFFFKNESNSDWYAITIEAWGENDNTYVEGKRVSSFSLLEKMRIHICKNVNKKGHHFHVGSLGHEFGTDLATGHRAKSKKEFRNEKINANYSAMEEINHKNFQRFKKAMYRIYQNYPSVNYAERLLKNAPACRILF